MHRRSILANTGAILTASLGGCLGAVSSEASPDNRIDEVATDTAPDLPLVPSISVISPQSTVDSPMSIRVRWENEQQEPVRFGEERSVMFHAAASDNEGAYLLGDAYGTWDEAVSRDECWYVSGEVGGDAAYRVRELKPGEAHETESKLYAATADCFTTDSYRFRTRISVGKSGDHPGDRPADEWGFVIHVESAQGRSKMVRGSSVTADN